MRRSEIYALRLCCLCHSLEMKAVTKSAGKEEVKEGVKAKPHGMRYYNTHTICVKSDLFVTKEQVSASVLCAIGDACNLIHRTIPCNYQINMVKNHEGKLLGFGYIWVTSPIIYHLLLGRNADGSKRECRIPDPDWVPPEGDMDEEISRSFDEHKHLFKSGKMGWGDWEVEFADPIEQKYTRPIITKKEKPLITLRPFNLTPEQRALSNAGCEYGKFELKPAFVCPITDNQVDAHVLYCHVIPPWMTEERLRNLFIPYTTDSITKVYHRDLHRDIPLMDAYPFVNIVHRRDPRGNTTASAYVSFDPCTYDAQFALFMCKSLPVSYSSSQQAVLQFTQSRKVQNTQRNQKYQKP